MRQTTQLVKAERLKRGTIPPFLSLSDAFSLARAIYENGGGQASPDLMSRLTGNSSSSSSFNKKLGAMKLYGLISDEGGNYSLTVTGNAIAAPVSEDDSALARKATLLNIPIFAKIYERHKGKLMPADEFLKHIIEQDSSIPRDFSSAWVNAFKSAAKAAGLLYSRPDGKIQLMESASSREPTPVETRSDTVEANIAVVPTTQRNDVSQATQAVPLAASGNVTHFKLSGGQVAEFTIPFGISQKDAERLKKYLKGLELMIDSAIVDAQALEDQQT